ncbi:hypothetical protein B296_00058133 [Ensete ventricosum]|uniref:Pentacotripeptide-repeat region of PRORP domain-containing protein n=1 Tax=Ensete ventricosum TaxID=4639 RepID=A0A426XNB5_ENSVE|nr:hypothetical protein B296_00058133 [Ensete ventricosum]
MLPRDIAKRSRCHTSLLLSAFNFSTASSLAASAKVLPKPPSIDSKCRSLLVSCNSRITRSGRDGDLLGAQSVFDRMPVRDVVSWTALLTAYAENGRISEARRIFDEMPTRNTVSWNAMISGYMRSAHVVEARELFSRMPARDVVCYSAMITGFAKCGMIKEAEEVYQEMPRRWRDPVASNALICGYLRAGKLEMAARVFEAMEVKDVVSWSSMVDGCCKCGRLSDARRVFNAMPERNVVSWTAMIRGYFMGGIYEDGFGLFLQMRREGVGINSTTLSVMIDATAELERIEEGIQIHALVLVTGLQNDVFLGDSIIVMYTRVGWMEAAKNTFNCMNTRDLVSWNSLLAGYIRYDMLEEANALFEIMPEKDAVSWTSIMVGFSNRGWISESVHLFHEMPVKDEVAWTAIISGFVANGEHENALWWFHRMVHEGFKPNGLTLSTVLSASANLAILDQGMQIHACIIKTDLESDVVVQSSLVSMYAKCGKVTDAYHVFLHICEPNLITVNAMMTAFSQHGLAEEALQLFKDMQGYGCKPNQVTFIAILSACARAGLVNEGYKHFKSMSSSYGIEPGPDHYTCTVDLLGRAGFLREALELIESMPFSPHSAIWGALLNASRMHSDLELAELAAQRLLDLEPNSATTYTVLSNMYGLAGRKKDEERTRMTKQTNGVRKSPGYSWVISDSYSSQQNTA